MGKTLYILDPRRPSSELDGSLSIDNKDESEYADVWDEVLLLPIDSHIVHQGLIFGYTRSIALAKPSHGTKRISLGLVPCDACSIP